MKYAKILVTIFVAAAANSLATWYMVGAGTFSPDGSRVAYLSNDVYHGGTLGFALYTVNADGSAKVRFDLKGRVWGAPCFSPDGSKIAFINDDQYHPNENIFLVNVDGSNMTTVTAYGDDPFEHDYNTVARTGVLGAGLTFSPDGRKIFYVSEELGSQDIFAINVDGTGKTRLTDFADCDESTPVFLPGGDDVLFAVKGSWEKGGIWIMNADGSGKKRLSCDEDVKLVALSPDGKKRAYEKHLGLDLDYRSYRFITYVADLDGSGRFKVAEKPYPGEGPAEGVDLEFSRDGKKVLYLQGDGVFVVNADGSGRKNLTPAWDYVESAAFFADCAKIAFVGRRYPYPDPCNIWTVDADGSSLKLFKATEGMDPGGVGVSPTGDRFLFESDYGEYSGDGDGDYFAVNADGSGLARLSEYSWYETRGGTFSPHGSKVAYLSNDVSSGGSTFAIYTVNADGSAKVRFDLRGGVWGEPYFTPDASKIAFINDDDRFPNGNVFLVDVDGKNLRPVTAYGDDPFEKTYGPARRIGALDKGLTFSPDALKILYCSAEFGSSDIFAVNVDGTGKTRLTAFAGCEESAPIFVRGGAEILFTVRSGGKKNGTWIMNADGSAKKKLLGHLWPVLALSGDGEKAAYTNYYPDINSKKHTLYVGDRTRRLRIAEEQGVFGDLSFSPDGEKVLYRQDGGVFVANADGSGGKELAGGWDSVSDPAFFADGAKIAFVVKSSAYPYPSDIYTMDADGSNLKLFKATEGMGISGVVVSAAGGRFLFCGHSDTPETDYFAVNADGSGLVRLSAYDPPPWPTEEE